MPRHNKPLKMAARKGTPTKSWHAPHSAKKAFEALCQRNNKNPQGLLMEEEQKGNIDRRDESDYRVFSEGEMKHVTKEHFYRQIAEKIFSVQELREFERMVSGKREKTQTKKTEKPGKTNWIVLRQHANKKRQIIVEKTKKVTIGGRSVFAGKAVGANKIIIFQKNKGAISLHYSITKFFYHYKSELMAGYKIYDFAREKFFNTTTKTAAPMLKEMIGVYNNLVKTT